VLINDSYVEIANPVDVLRHVKASLKPAGRLGIVNFRRDGLGPGPPPEDRVEEAVVIKDANAAGLRLISRNTPLPFQYLLVFGL
jgi:predicted methyltransferase